MEKKREYIKSFDGLRVLAITGVLFYHLRPSTVPGGYLGVVIFFVMAGYLSFEHAMYDRELDVPRGSLVLDSIAKKIKKLFPPLIFMMFFVVLNMLLFYRADLGVNQNHIRGSILSLNNYFQIFSGTSYFDRTGVMMPFKHIWALSLEFQFYILFFVLFYGRYSPKKKKRWFLILFYITIISFVASVLLLLLKVDNTRVYYGLGTRLYSFSIGAMAALVARRKTTDPAILSDGQRSGANLILLLILGLSYFIFGESSFVFYVGFFLYSLLTAIFMLTIRPSSCAVSKFLSSVPFNALAKRSYHLYLWHFPVIAFMDKIFAHIQIGLFFYSTLCLLFCIIISEISYKTVGFFMKYLNAKTVFITLFIMAIVLLALPYKMISDSSAEKKQLKTMQETINKNEKVQEENSKNPNMNYEENIFVNEYLETIDISNFDDDEVIIRKQAEEEDEKSKKARNEEDSPRFKRVIESIKWVNEFDKELFMDLDEYKEYRNTKILLIGDSITSMCYHTVIDYFPKAVVDSKKSRKLKEAYKVFSELDGDDTGNYVVLSIGTNGGVTPSQLDKFRKKLGGRKMILFTIVLPIKNTEAERNQEIIDYVKAHDDVYLVDWYAVSKKRPSLFFKDNTHPNVNGGKVFCQILMKKIIELENE